MKRILRKLLGVFMRLRGFSVQVPSVDGPEPTLETLTSQLCTQNQFMTPIYLKWCAEIKETPRYHRKQWEHVYIAHALDTMGVLKQGSFGIGFGVGKEPLIALFAKYGGSIVATDMDYEQAKKIGWVDSAQYSLSKKDLNERGICDQVLFDEAVSMRPVDMNRIDEDLRKGAFDFLWSSCSMDHLGSVEKGIAFVLNSLKCLRPGGIAVHTTEYNVSSNDDTLDNAGVVLYRRRDIEKIGELVTAGGGSMLAFNPQSGLGLHDRHYDVPPYAATHHLKLMIDRYISTSVGFIIRRAP